MKGERFHSTGPVEVWGCRKELKISTHKSGNTETEVSKRESLLRAQNWLAALQYPFSESRQGSSVLGVRERGIRIQRETWA